MLRNPPVRMNLTFGRSSARQQRSVTLAGARPVRHRPQFKTTSRVWCPIQACVGHMIARMQTEAILGALLHPAWQRSNRRAAEHQ
jgi:hypothetical protein